MWDASESFVSMGFSGEVLPDKKINTRNSTAIPAAAIDLKLLLPP